MITNEMLQVVAEYDGYKVVKQMPRAYGGGAPMYKLITFKRCIKYATSMDWLHPVAMKVYDDLQEIKPIVEKIGSPIYYMGKDLLSRCGNNPINGQYIDLLNAVYKSIIFINQNKETCKTN